MTRFKAKRIDNGQWVEGSYIHASNTPLKPLHAIQPYHGLMVEVDPSTLHQEIGGEWYTMEELRENLLDAGINKAQMHRNNGLQEENAQLKAEVERLKGKNAKLNEVFERNGMNP